MSTKILSQKDVDGMIKGLATIDPGEPPNMYIFDDDDELPRTFPNSIAGIRGFGDSLYEPAPVPGFSAAQNDALEKHETYAESCRMLARLEAARHQAAMDNLATMLDKETEWGRVPKEFAAEFHAVAETTRQFLALLASITHGLSAFPRSCQAPQKPEPTGPSIFGAQAEEVNRLLQTMNKKVDSLRGPSSARGGDGRPKARGGRNGHQARQRPRSQRPTEEPKAKKAKDMGSETGKGTGTAQGGRGRTSRPRGPSRGSAGRSRGRGRGRGRGD
jgi:hypothetical protein